MEISEIEKVIKSALSEKRYYHSLCVMERCAEYAEIYGVDKEKAKRVGLAHDIAKEMSDEEKLRYTKQNDIYVDNVELRHLGLLHAKIGADIAKKKFGFSDDMCNAIRLHTTGGENMELLDKVLYVADATGKDRTWKDVDAVIQMARQNIDDAVLYILNMEITDKVKEGKLIHVNSILARNSIIMV